MYENDIRRISVIACVALVVVRLAIGWQLLYEGLWKIDTLDSAKPWTAEPYLKNAQGPLRDYFRELTGDPNDLHDLDYETVAARWTGWAERFKKHYGLSKQQQERLDRMLDGPQDFRVELKELPEGVELRGSLGAILEFRPDEERLILDGEAHMTPREKQALLAQVNFDEQTDTIEQVEDPVVKNFIERVLYLYERQSRLSYKEKALATLKGDPEFAGQFDPEQQGTIDEKRPGNIEVYRDRLARYENKLANAKTKFDYDHLEYDWKEIQQMRAELVGPIRQLEQDLKWDAEKLLTTEQLAKGPLPPKYTAQRDIDMKTIWTLTIVGGLLLAGFMTRLAALAGAFLIFQFYLAYPPLPGYPPPPGPEHALFINKNMIEILMLVAFVFLPTGRWFGIDAVFSGWFSKEELDDRV